jgi:hypothetical protein
MWIQTIYCKDSWAIGPGTWGEIRASPKTGIWTR